LRDLGRHTEAFPIYQEGLAIARKIDFPLTEAMFKFHLANDAAVNRRWDEAETRMMEAYFEFSKLNNLWAMGFSKDRLAMFAHYAGEIEKAHQHYTDMLEIARTTHFDYQIDIALLGLSDVARERGDWQTVYHLNLEILQLRYDIAPNDRMLVVLASLAEATWMLNDLSQSRRRIAEAVRLLREWEVAERHVWRLLSEVFLQLLYTTAGLLMQAEDFVRALSLMSFAEVLLSRCEPKSLVVKRFVQLFPMLLATCRDALTTDDFAAAQARGKTLSFDTVLAELSVFR
jgi:hypothetical protein